MAKSESHTKSDHHRTPKGLKSVLFALLLGILFVPVVQEWTGVLPAGKLAGVENIIEKIPLSDTAWFSGSFQNNFSIRHYRWMGLRPAMVRLRNQVDYSLYGEVYRSIMVGKEGELFRRGSLKAMRGLNFKGQDHIEYHADHTAILQKHFADRNVRMLVVLTPSKLRCMPDYLPGYLLPSPNPNNYDAFTEAFGRMGVDYLDLEQILTQKMQEQPLRVFPRTGTHWTDLGAFYGAKHILSEMEKRDGRNYRHMRAVQPEMSADMRDTDADAGDLLNLVWDLPVDTIAYPVIQMEAASQDKYRPRVLVIADSFWWKIYNQNIHRDVFAPGSQYRYYNYEVFSDQWEDAKFINDFNLQKTVEGVDWVILCVNEGNMHRYPFNFVDQVLGLYY
jgi:hypothetical protein